MLREPTKEKLYAMRLPVMAMAWEQQEKDPKLRELDFGERFGLLVEAEYRARDNRRLMRLLKQAELRIPDACMEDLQSGPERGLPVSTVRQLATGVWIGEHLNVLVSGATGVGKSYLACALGQMACRQGLSVLYRRVPRLFEELRIARERRAPMPASSSRWPRRTCSSSTTSGSAISMKPSGTTSSKCWRTATASAPPSSRASCPSVTGTTGSATRRWPTQFWTASSTTRTKFSSRVHPDERLTPRTRTNDRDSHRHLDHEGDPVITKARIG